jgi:hypothetical protein
MNKLILQLGVILALVPISKSEGLFENPLEDLEFVYVEKNLPDLMGKALSTQTPRVKVCARRSVPISLRCGWGKTWIK